MEFIGVMWINDVLIIYLEISTRSLLEGERFDDGCGLSGYDHGVDWQLDMWKLRVNCLRCRQSHGPVGRGGSLDRYLMRVYQTRLARSIGWKALPQLLPSKCFSRKTRRLEPLLCRGQMLFLESFVALPFACSLFSTTLELPKWPD